MAIRTLDLQTKTVNLNSGFSMPILGLGTYSLHDDICINAIQVALEHGALLLDTANFYHNEETVGLGIKRAKVSREKVFVVTKLYPNQYANPDIAIEEALSKLDCDYLDLMLLHHPGEHDIKAYKAMERAHSQGKIRSLGLSNWYIKELQEFLRHVVVLPSVVQNEIHPYYQDRNVVEYIQSLDMIVQAWYPLGGRGYTSKLLSEPVLKTIALELNKSVAQVILRWDLQHNVIPLPGSSNSEHIIDNTRLFDFVLNERHLLEIAKLDRQEKHDWY